MNTNYEHGLRREDFSSILDYAAAIRAWHSKRAMEAMWPVGKQESDNDNNPSYERDAERAMDAQYWGCEVDLI